MRGFKKLNDEVFSGEDRIVKVDQQLLEELKTQAGRNPRRRARLCAHKDTQERVHEMIIVMARGMYVHPHKHLTKGESFHVIEGAAVVVFFDEEGKIDEVMRIGDFQSGNLFYFRNDEPRYHTQIVTSEYLVVHETTSGPFNRADMALAPWAPDGSDAAIASAYLEELSRNVASF